MKETKSRDNFIYIIIGLIAVIVLGIALLRNRPQPAPAGAEALAQCLTDKGVKFYGAFWCSHCKEQKESFGSAAAKLPYIECAESTTTLSKECQDKNIASFPTWINPAGQRRTGFLTFPELAEFSGCQLQ